MNFRTKLVGAALLALGVLGVALAQSLVSDLSKIEQDRSFAYDFATGQWTESNGDRLGFSLWNNMAFSGYWFEVEAGYIYLDWGGLQTPATGLSDEVIDGFTFSYGTNNLDPAGESFELRYLDSCTGWGGLGVEEARFTMTGLPNGYGLPTQNGWLMAVTVDLEGTGYEFLLNERFGQAYRRLNTPPAPYETGMAMGRGPNQFGNGPTGTAHAFDIYYPNHTYNGTWWIGSGIDLWCTWPGELFGPAEAGAGLEYYGIGATGNDTALYAVGAWGPGQEIRFLLRRHCSQAPAWLGISTRPANAYLPGLGVTRLVGSFLGGSLRPMVDPLYGDFTKYSVVLPKPLPPGLALYFQGALVDSMSSPPVVTASNAVKKL